MLLWCLCMYAAPSFAASTPEDYITALKRIEQGESPSSLAPLFEMALGLQQIMVPRLERLTKGEYEALRGRMQGFLISREEAVRFDPNPDFFLELALRYGTVEDKDFFRRYALTFEGGWPAYLEPMTDIQGCTRFSGRGIDSLYALWEGYLKNAGRTAAPALYRQQAAQYMQQIHSALLSDCSCDTKEETTAGMQGFLRGNPSAPGNTDVESRLRAGLKTLSFSGRCNF